MQILFERAQLRWLLRGGSDCGKEVGTGEAGMRREENGRKHMTKEQLRIMLAGKDAAAEKDIPDSARRQMTHRPYQKGEGNGNKEKGNSL